MINARAEGIDKKNSFKKPFRKRCCLLLAEGFCEWKKPDRKTKIPFLFRLRSGELFAFARLWDKWNERDEPLTTFTIITTDSNKLSNLIHNKMPVIIQQKTKGIWLDPKLQDPAKLHKLLKSFPYEEMETYEDSSIVNSPQHDMLECIAPQSWSRNCYESIRDQYARCNIQYFRSIAMS